MHRALHSLLLTTQTNLQTEGRRRTVSWMPAVYGGRCSGSNGFSAFIWFPFKWQEPPRLRGHLVHIATTTSPYHPLPRPVRHRPPGPSSRSRAPKTQTQCHARLVLLPPIQPSVERHPSWRPPNLCARTTERTGRPRACGAVRPGLGYQGRESSEQRAAGIDWRTGLLALQPASCRDRYSRAPNVATAATTPKEDVSDVHNKDLNCYQGLVQVLLNLAEISARGMQNVLLRRQFCRLAATPSVILLSPWSEAWRGLRTLQWMAGKFGYA